MVAREVTAATLGRNDSVAGGAGDRQTGTLEAPETRLRAYDSALAFDGLAAGIDGWDRARRLERPGTVKPGRIGGLPRQQKAAAKKRRANGEGAIVERADGSWMFSLRLGRDRETGKLRRLVLYAPTRAALLRKVQDERARAGGTLKPRARGTVREFVETWVENEIRPNRRANTYALYHSVLTKHALPLLDSPLDRFDAEAVDALYRTLRANGVTPSVLNRISLTLRTAFEWRRRRTGVANPFDLAAKPRHTNAETAILDVDQVHRLLAAARKAKDRYEALLAVLALGGLRLGEALGLQWSDVDFATGMLSIRRQLLELKGFHETAEPKTRRSRRTIPLARLALEALKRRQQAAERESHGSAFVFVTLLGGHPRRSNLRRDILAPALLAAKLAPVSFHGLRGSAATAMAQRGIDLATIGSVLGQARPAVTLERYVHASIDSQRRAIDQMDAAMRKASRKTTLHS